MSLTWTVAKVWSEIFWRIGWHPLSVVVLCWSSNSTATRIFLCLRRISTFLKRPHETVMFCSSSAMQEACFFLISGWVAEDQLVAVVPFCPWNSHSNVKWRNHWACITSGLLYYDIWVCIILSRFCACKLRVRISSGLCAVDVRVRIRSGFNICRLPGCITSISTFASKARIPSVFVIAKMFLLVSPFRDGFLLRAAVAGNLLGAFSIEDVLFGIHISRLDSLLFCVQHFLL